MFTPGSTPFGAFDNDAEFASDADKILDYTRRKLGEPIIYVHLSASQVYASFEEACLEFSAIMNQYQAKSTLATFLGSATGSLQGSENTYPSQLIEFQKKLAEPYGEEAGVNGPHTLYTGSILLNIGQQKYDLQALLSGSGPLTGSNVNARLRVKEVFHFSPLQQYRFFGTTSALNYLNTQFQFESFTPETIFYLLPIWEDVLRGMQFKLSDKVRRSNYSYEINNNVLTLYPAPSDSINLFFTYMLPPDPTVPANPQEAASFAGVSNLSNIPFGNIKYSNLNSISKQWIRRFAFNLAKETEGQIRSKFGTVPIPNGDLTLNGPELIADAKAEQQTLREELKQILEETTYQKLAEQQAQMAQNIQDAIKDVPLGIYIG